jgi:hypothetical protein
MHLQPVKPQEVSKTYKKNNKKYITHFLYGLLGVDGSQEVVEDKVGG